MLAGFVSSTIPVWLSLAAANFCWLRCIDYSRRTCRSTLEEHLGDISTRGLSDVTDVESSVLIVLIDGAGIESEIEETSVGMELVVMGEPAAGHEHSICLDVKILAHWVVIEVDSCCGCHGSSHCGLSLCQIVDGREWMSGAGNHSSRISNINERRVVYLEIAHCLAELNDVGR